MKRIILSFLFVFIAFTAFCQDVPLEGYDYGKLNNPNHLTPKYLFGRVAQKNSLDGVHGKDAAEALLRKMLPDLKAAGMVISDVKGDKILVHTDVGWEWVDVVRGAGSHNPGWWWGSEGKPAPGMENTPAPPPSGNGHSGSHDPHNPAGNDQPVAPSAGSGKPLDTVPDKPDYKDFSLEKKNPEAAIISAATFVKEKNPRFFNSDERSDAYQAMTLVIGILRANGFDAHRVVNHPSRAIGDPWRYGSDALVLNGKIYDVYQGMGDPNQSVPQALYQGPYSSNRARE